MNNYFSQLNKEIKEYFSILSPEFPEWLLDYINTPEMQRLSKISMVCGTDYSKIFNYKSFNSTLNHSIGVALILWNYTHDKRQTLAGLFHDIATPVFKHCIDFMNGDSEHQESTEEKTEIMIRNSDRIMFLLNRDHIKVTDVCDYHIYPLADNDTPKLSADRFEYTFSNGLFLYDAWNLQEIKHFYDNVTIFKNEDGFDELGFKDIHLCENYVHAILPIFANYHSDNNRTVMQFIADIVKSMNAKGYLSIDDLYTLSEQEVLDKILTCDDTYLKESFIKFQNAAFIYHSNTPVSNKYCTHVKAKIRYIIPLTQLNGKVARINELSKQASADIDDYLNIKHYPYTGFDFDFKPYECNYS